MHANGFRFHAQSVAGVATACYVDEVDVLFDCGACFKQSFRKSHVFISHGHVDHIKDIVGHAARRQLCQLPPAKYYVPYNVLEDVQSIFQSFQRMQEAEIQADIIPVHPNQDFELDRSLVIRSYATFHRVKSFGYILYRKTKRLKEKYSRLCAEELVRLKKEQVEICSFEMVPEIGYTGDTQFALFEVADGYSRDGTLNDFLRVKLLITEATFVDDKRSVEEAIAKGHIHLHQIIEKAYLFNEVPCMALIHFSARYSASYLTECRNCLSDALRAKLLFYHPNSREI